MVAKPSLKVEGAAARSMAEPSLKLEGGAAWVPSDTQMKHPRLGRPKLQKSSIDSKSKQETPQPFGLNVSSVSGTVITVQANRTDVCSSLQKQVANKLNLSPYRITISSESGILQGKKTLEECAISEDSELFFVIGEADKWREMSREAFIELVRSRGLATGKICARPADFDNYKFRQQFIPRLESFERKEERKRRSEEHRQHLQQSVVSQVGAMMSELGVSGAANAIEAKVADLETRCNQRSSELRAMADDAQRDLDEALPALTATCAALDALDKRDIMEVKSFAKPPPSVLMVCEAMCVLFKVPPTWAEARKLLSDCHLLRNMMDYDKDNISPDVFNSLDVYVQRPGFNPDEVGRVSRAAQAICTWARAMHTYDRVAKVVWPKRERIMEAEDDTKNMYFELMLWRSQLAELSA